MAPKRDRRAQYDVEANISTLSVAIQCILAGQDPKSSFEELFRAGYSIVLHKKTTILQNRISNAAEQWLIKEIQPSVTSLAYACYLTEEQPEANMLISNEARIASQHLLVTFKQIGEQYEKSITMVSDIFTYMNRVAANDSRSFATSTSILYRCFRNCILQTRIGGQADITVQRILNRIIVKHLELDRNGDIVDRRLIKSCIDFILSLSEFSTDSSNDSHYTSLLESEVLQTSRAFYTAERNMWQDHLATNAYARQIKKRASDEQDLCQSIFPKSTTVKLLKAMDDEFNLS